MEKIIIHCDDNENPKWGIPELRKLHKERGFGDIGYHFWINYNGQVYNTRPINTIGCHTYGHNFNSIGICLHGRKEFTIEQFNALKSTLIDLCDRYKLSYKAIFPHNKFTKVKTCPNFDLGPLIDSIKEKINGSGEKGN